MSIIYKLILTVFFILLAVLPSQPTQATAPLVPEQFSCTNVTEIPQNECEALVDIYEGADGPNWSNSSGWLATTTPCSWHGVTCSNNFVSELDLPSNGLSNLSSSIGEFMNLTELALSSNQFSSLPAEIGNLTNLTALFLNSNHLSNLPSEIGNLTNLTTLDLSDNQMSNFPSEIGNLISLTELDLSGNQMSGLPPEIGNLTNLAELSLVSNQLSSLPPEIGNLTNLMRLSLGDNLKLFVGDNQLSSLPSEIGNLTNLIELSVHSNQLSSLPPEIGTLTNLTSLSLSGNQLSSLPSEIGNLINLTEFSLTSNQLSSLPAEIGDLTNLTKIFLDFNQLGSVPVEIGNLINLTSLSLSGNQLSSLPPQIGNLNDLTDISLSLNQLSSLPHEIGNLNNLRVLFLNSNQLSSLPTEIGNLINLTALILDSNQLSSLPSEIGNLNNLKQLELNSNQFSSLPPEIGNLTNLTWLFLDSNLLSSLPPEIGNLNNLFQLRLSSNQLSTLTPEIGNLNNLSSLSLSSNQLSSLPPEIGNLTNLTSLYLSSNQLDSLPPQIGNLNNLRSFFLPSNQLSSLPSEIGNLTNLMELDLSGNQLNGLPISISSLNNLSSLSLQHNRLIVSNDTLLTFLEQHDPDWEDTQTVAPTDMTATVTGPGRIELTWTPILFQKHGGFYEISIAEDTAFTVHGTTTSKSDSHYIIDGLTSGVTYRIRIRTYTPALDVAQEIWSEYSVPISVEVEGESGEIQGSVWSDANADGIRDAGEIGLAGALVRLQSSDDCTLSMTTTTDIGGEYIFSSLDPSQSYFITFEAPDGTIFSPQDVGGDDTIDSDVHPNTGQAQFDNIPADGVDAGIIEHPDGGTGGITGTVYLNENGEGIGICGATVELLDSERNALVTNLTNVDGNYAFVDLQSGDYIVKFTEPKKTIFSVDNTRIDLENGETGLIAVLTDEIVQGIDVIAAPNEVSGDTLDCTGKGSPGLGQAGLSASMIWNAENVQLSESPEQNFTGSIEGIVWNDFNRNGLSDDDAYASGVTILCRCEDEDEADGETHNVKIPTGRDGYYKIKDLNIEGEYVIEIQLPGNKILTKSGIRGPGGGGSDLNPSTRKSEPIDLPESNSTVSINAGLIDPPLGDVNCDGSADSIDALFILQMDIGNRARSPQCPSSTSQQLELYEPGCDVSGDEMCDLTDALFILQCDVGMFNLFCPENITAASDVRQSNRNNLE